MKKIIITSALIAALALSANAKEERKSWENGEKRAKFENKMKSLKGKYPGALEKLKKLRMERKAVFKANPGLKEEMKNMKHKFKQRKK